MRLNIFGRALALLPLAACAAPQEFTPMQKHLNRVAGAEIVMRDCPAFGGYGSVAQMRADADRNLQLAQGLGSTPADLEAARTTVSKQYAAAYFLVGPAETCHHLINTLAWNGASPPS